MFLSTKDIERLTGYKRKAQQCQELARQGIPFRVNARGEPIVTESYINGISKKAEKQSWQPNLKMV